MTTKSAALPAVPLHRFVRHVSKAIRATKKMMFWSVIFDEDDIRERLERHIAEYGDPQWAMESTIESILSEHQATLENAVREQCDMATKEALSRLPNSAMRINEGMAEK